MGQREPVCQTDLLATLVDLLGEDLPDDQGEGSVSFRAVLEGTPPEHRWPLVHHSYSGQFAIRDGNWKLVTPDGKGKKRDTL